MKKYIKIKKLRKPHLKKKTCARTKGMQKVFLSAKRTLKK